MNKRKMEVMLSCHTLNEQLLIQKEGIETVKECVYFRQLIEADFSIKVKKKKLEKMS